MRHLVIGIPARNEATTIVALAGAIEDGAALLGEVATVELVLAYQDSDDDTLGRFVARRSRIPQRVLRSPAGISGKGRNVKLLIEHAVASDADLLLVDGDMRDYAPSDVARFVAAGYDNRWDMVLPLWCRPWGHANVTNYLAVPLLHALFGARVRQPLAGQRLLARHWLRRLAPTLLPDDYGVDIAFDHGRARQRRTRRPGGHVPGRPRRPSTQQPNNHGRGRARDARTRRRRTGTRSLRPRRARRLCPPPDMAG